VNTDRDRDAQGRPRNARPRDALGRPLPRDAAGEFVEEALPSDPDELLALGIAHFDAGRFFQAHEAWEAAWHPAPEPERDFWQGITQIAVGFTHYQRGNPVGAATLLARGAAKLERYEDGAHGFPVARIASAARAAAAAIEHGRPIQLPRIAS
jgi:predicted metal-dependent hydrolase